MNKKYKDQVAPCKYDPSWIVKLAQEQLPGKPEIAEALKKCQTVVGFCGCGCGDPTFIKKEECGHVTSIVLKREDGIEIIVDVLKDSRIVGIEIGEWHKKK